MPQRQPTPYFAPFIDTSTLATTNVSDLDTITRSSLTTDSNIPQIISNLNTMAFHQEGNDTNYNQTCLWTPPASGHLVKFTINIAAILDLTTRSSDSITFQQVQISLTEAGSTGNLLWARNYLTGFAAQDAAGETRMFIASETVANQSIPVSEGVTISINVTLVNSGDTGNIVWVTGVVPFFPNTIDSNSKFFSQSGIVFYIDRDRLAHEEKRP